MEAELTRLGAAHGAAVTIGDVTFDFEPTFGESDEAYVPSARGTDERLAPSSRSRAADRLAAKRARRRPSHPDDAAPGP